MNNATKKFHRTAMSKRDFWEAQEFLTRLAHEKHKTTRYALLTSAIIAYSRPFSRNEKDAHAEADGRLHICPSSILDPIQLAVHSEVIQLRNKLVAHAEYAASPVKLIEAHKDGMVLFGPYVEKEGRKWDLRDYLEQFDHAIFLRITELFACHCQNELFKLKDE